MTDTAPSTQVEMFDAHRAVVSGVELPSPPPTRIRISGHTYLIQAPRVPLPAIANVVKVVLNYVMAASKVANNILHIQTGGSFVPSDPTSLKALANYLYTVFTTGGSAIPNLFTSTTKLQGITVKDMGGTTAQGVADGPPIAGVMAGTSHPPQVSTGISWDVAGTWRGGKPRTYLPPPSINASVPAGSSTIDPTFAAQAEACFTQVMNAINAPTGGPSGTFKLGMVSYYHGHVLRPSPLFMQFINVKVHERLDSQRRRSGRESSFPVIP